MARNQVGYVCCFQSIGYHGVVVTRDCLLKTYHNPTQASTSRLCAVVNRRIAQQKMKVLLWPNGWLAYVSIESRHHDY